MFAGGFASLYVGAYAYSNSQITLLSLNISGATQVLNVSHVIAYNIATNCSAVVSNSHFGSSAYGACNSLHFCDSSRDLQLILDCFCRWLCLAVRRRLRVFKSRRSIHSVDIRSDLFCSRQQPHCQQYCNKLRCSCQQCLLWLQRIRCMQQPALSCLSSRFAADAGLCLQVALPRCTSAPTRIQIHTEEHPQCR